MREGRFAAGENREKMFEIIEIKVIKEMLIILLSYYFIRNLKTRFLIFHQYSLTGGAKLLVQICNL